MDKKNLSPIIAAIAVFVGAFSAGTAHGQATTGTTSTAPTPTAPSTAATTGTTGSTTTTTTGTTTTGTTGTATTAPSTPAGGEAQYLARLQSRYPALASQSNLQSLVHGLRTGTPVTLTSTQPGAGGTTTTTSTTFTPPTRPMGYGNITRAMTVATRQLAAAGVTNPSPQQLQTALMGGTLTTPQGSVQMQGVLQLRSQGMGWGQIAHTVGVRPGMGTGRAPTQTTATAGSGGTTTAAGGSTTGPSTRSPTQASSRGIVTAAGGSPHGASQARGSASRGGSAIVAANGATSHGGSGQGSGAGRGHSGKH